MPASTGVELEIDGTTLSDDVEGVSELVWTGPADVEDDMLIEGISLEETIAEELVLGTSTGALLLVIMTGMELLVETTGTELVALTGFLGGLGTKFCFGGRT
jgi:hypothetical protein